MDLDELISGLEGGSKSDKGFSSADLFDWADSVLGKKEEEPTLTKQLVGFGRRKAEEIGQAYANRPLERRSLRAQQEEKQAAYQGLQNVRRGLSPERQRDVDLVERSMAEHESFADMPRERRDQFQAAMQRIGPQQAEDEAAGQRRPSSYAEQRVAQEQNTLARSLRMKPVMPESLERSPFTKKEELAALQNRVQQWSMTPRGMNDRVSDWAGSRATGHVKEAAAFDIQKIAESVAGKETGGKRPEPDYEKLGKDFAQEFGDLGYDLKPEDFAKIGKEMLPSAQLQAAIEHFRKNGTRTAEEKWSQRTVESAPMMGAGVQAANLGRLKFAADVLNHGEVAPTAALSERDRAAINSDPDKTQWAAYTVAKALVEAEESKDEGMLEKIATMALAIPGIAAEFEATGGAYTAAKQGVKSVVNKMVAALAKKVADRTMRMVVTTGGRALSATAGVSAGLAAHTIFNPQQIIKATAQKAYENDQDFIEALPKGAASAAIELGSERLGGLFGKIPVPARMAALRHAMEAMERKGIHSPWGEGLEERAAEIIGGMTKVEKDYGTTGQLLDPKRRAEGLRQVAIEMAAFLVPSVGAGAHAAVDAIAERRQVQAELMEHLSRTASLFDQRTAQSAQQDRGRYGELAATSQAVEQQRAGWPQTYDLPEQLPAAADERLLSPETDWRSPMAVGGQATNADTRAGESQVGEQAATIGGVALDTQDQITRAQVELVSQRAGEAQLSPVTQLERMIGEEPASVFREGPVEAVNRKTGEVVHFEASNEKQAQDTARNQVAGPGRVAEEQRPQGLDVPPSGAEPAPAEAKPTPAKSTPPGTGNRRSLRRRNQVLKPSLRDAIDKAPRNSSGYVEIWQLREQFPELSREQFDKAIKALPAEWQIPISDRRELTSERLRQSVEGVGETIAYIEPPGTVRPGELKLGQPVASHKRSLKRAKVGERAAGKTMVSAVRSLGGIDPSKLSKGQLASIREAVGNADRIGLLKKGSGKGLDDMAESLRQQGALAVPEDRMADDYLMERITGRAAIDTPSAHEEAVRKEEADYYRKMAEEQEAMPTNQGNLYSPFKDSAAQQRKMFSEKPFPEEVKDRQDLPGQQMLPGTELAGSEHGDTSFNPSEFDTSKASAWINSHGAEIYHEAMAAVRGKFMNAAAREDLAQDVVIKFAAQVKSGAFDTEAFDKAVANGEKPSTLRQFMRTIARSKSYDAGRTAKRRLQTQAMPEAGGSVRKVGTANVEEPAEMVGNFYYGMQGQPPTIETYMKDWNNEAKIGHHDILKKMSAMFGIPLHAGKLENGAAAVYQANPEVAVFAGKYFGHLGLAAHEVAHHTDLSNKLVVSLPAALHAELGMMDYDPARQSAHEGFAEYMRMYLTQDGVAEEWAPLFTDHFQKWLEAHPKTQAAVQQTRKMVDQWREQGYRKRAEAAVSYRQEEEGLSTLARWRKLWTDRLVALKKFTQAVEKKMDRKLTKAESPYIIARAFAGKGQQMAIDAWRNGIFSLTTSQRMSGGLEPVLASIGSEDQLKAFETYLVNKRLIDIWTHPAGKGPGYNAPISQADAQAYVDEFKDKKTKGGRTFDELSRRVYQYGQGMLDMAEEVGLISTTEKLKILNSTDFYVPIRRVGDETGDVIEKMSDEGSGLPIKDPLTSLLQMTNVLYPKAIKAMISNSIARFGDKNSAPRGLGEWIYEVPASQAGAENVIKLGDKHYRVKAELMDAMENTGFRQLPGGLEMAAGIAAPFAKLKRMGAVALRASFGVIVNPAKDVFALATRTSEPGVFTGPTKQVARFLGNYVGSILEAIPKGGWIGAHQLGGLVRTDAAYREFAARFVGAASTELGQNISGGEAYQNIRDLWVGTQGIKGQLGDLVRLVKDPMTFMERLRDIGKKVGQGRQKIEGFLSFSERAAREAEVEAILRRHGFTPDKMSSLPTETILDAVFGGNNITQDFLKGGTAMMAVNRVAAFSNANLQGPIQTYEAWKENKLRFTMRALWMITLPAVAMWLKYKDEDWYRELPWWLKLSHWVFPPGEDGKATAVPMPFEAGMIFGSGPVALLESLRREDPEAAKHWTKEMAAQLNVTPNKGIVPVPQAIGRLTPDAIKLPFELLANYQFYRDRPIVDQGLAHLKPEDQFYEYNTSASQYLGRMLGESPAKIDYGIHGLTGGLGTDVLKIPEEGPIRALGFSRLMKSVARGQSIDDFYQKKTELDQAAASAKKNQTPHEKAEHARFNRAAEMISDLRREAKGKSTEIKDQYSRLITGAARWALGKEELTDYPSPFGPRSNRMQLLQRSAKERGF